MAFGIGAALGAGVASGVARVAIPLAAKSVRAAIPLGRDAIRTGIRGAGLMTNLAERGVAGGFRAVESVASRIFRPRARRGASVDPAMQRTWRTAGVRRT